MNSLRRHRVVWGLSAIAILIFLLAACQPDPETRIISPELGDQMIADAAPSDLVVEPTPEPATLADLTEEEILAGLEPDAAAAVAAGDVAQGETLALTNGCIGCHALDPETQMTGPTWYNMGNTAVNRVADQGPADYLYASISAPNEFVVPDYPANVMPQTYVDSLSTDDIGHLVAYLLAQQGQ
jgi:cytochrome c553